MLTITTTNIADLLNTGNELTAQCISGNLQELFFGVGDDAYMYREDAASLLGCGPDADIFYQDGKNPLFVHLTPVGLECVLVDNEFVVTDDED